VVTRLDPCQVRSVHKVHVVLSDSRSSRHGAGVRAVALPVGTVLDQKPRDDHQSCSALRRVKQRLSITGSPPLAPGSHGHHRRRAHAASPATGQGASIALDDAVILAKSLRDTGDPDGAFVVYEQLRRDRVQANIAASTRMSAQRPPDQQHRAPASQRSAGSNEAIDSQLEWHTRLV
jgi:hypothetical protein